MNDVFISYSRRDKVFTQKLYEALTAANRIVWADWDSIPAASDWDAEIKQGIQETNSVLFVLSPEWIKSNECRKELVHAVVMGKRLFPILYIPVDPNDVPPELAKINWVYLRDSDDFDKGFQTLCSAMDTDLEWIKTHTRIQVRALEWERKNRSASFALRGEDLTEGEQFIAGAANKDPVPTTLQSEYILASRKDATRRQRQTLAGVTVALIVSIALGIAAFFQRQEAVTQRATAQANLIVAQTARVDANNNAATAVANEKEAKRQAQIALARQLASQAQFINSAHSSHQMIATLLNVQSMKLVPNADAANFLINNNHSPELIGSIDNVEAIDVSPDAKFMVVGIGNTAQVWDIAAGKEVAHMTHDDVVKIFKFSPDGKYVVSGSQDKTARVWDGLTGKEVARMTHDGSVNAVAFSPDGKYVVSGSSDQTARVWEAMTGREVARKIHDGSVNAVTFSPDGKYVDSRIEDGTGHTWYVANGNEIAVDGVFSFDGKYVTSNNNNGDYFFHVWETESGTEIARMNPNTSSGSTMFSPDGKYVLFWSYFDSTASIWEALTGKEVAQMKKNDDQGVISGAFSPDGKYVVLGSNDGTARVWETMTGKEVARMTHDAPVESVAFSLDGKYVISVSEDKTARMWEALTGKEIAHMTGANSTWLGPEDRYLLSLSDDHILQVWNVVGVKGNVRTVHGGAVDWVTFSPDGKYVLSGSGGFGGNKTAIVWDAASGKEITRMSISKGYFAAFSPDGKYVVAITGGANNAVRLWEAMTGQEVARVTYDNPVNSLAFSGSGKYVASGISDGTVHVWEALTGKEVAHMKHGHSLSGTSVGVISLAFSPDGKYIVSGGDDDTARVWEALTGKEVAHMAHGGTIQSVAFSSDGKYVVSGGGSIASVWEAVTGKEIARTPHDGGIQSVAFSSDGKYVVSGGGSIASVWEAMTGNEIAHMTHDSRVLSVTFSPDGKYVVSNDGIARVWEAMTGKEIARMTRDGAVNSVEFSSDGKYIVYGSNNGTVRIWSWQPEEIIANACATMPRNLTHAEWAQFIGDAMPYQAVCENLPIEPVATATPIATP